MTDALDENRSPIAIASAGGGVYGVHNAITSGDLTGRKTLYHGSSDTRIADIRKHGLIPHAKPGASLQADPGLHNANKGLVFATPSKAEAAMYSFQQQGLDNGMDLVSVRGDRAKNMEMLKRIFKPNHPGIAQISLPTWKEEFHGQINPEVARLKNNKLALLMNGLTERDVDIKYQQNVHVNKGAIPAQYILGSDKYSKLGMDEFKEYVSKNRGRFAQGVGKLGLGVAGIAGAAHLALGQEKKAGEYVPFTPEGMALGVTGGIAGERLGMLAKLRGLRTAGAIIGSQEGYDMGKELAARRMNKQASAPVEAGKGLGAYLRDNVAVPIVPIFIADVAAHVAADKISEAHKVKPVENKYLNKVAQLLEDVQ